MHHNHFFDFVFEKCYYDITNLTVMRKSRGLLAHLNWTCGQGQAHLFLLTNFCTFSHHPQHSQIQYFSVNS